MSAEQPGGQITSEMVTAAYRETGLNRDGRRPNAIEIKALEAALGTVVEQASDIYMHGWRVALREHNWDILMDAEFWDGHRDGQAAWAAVQAAPALAERSEE